ncbi:hypothetical protein Lalb_Chr11g0067651 [Lupinus albus]|uniref:Uncharacterized protein n=1 Tax=Lupinus albus TaxID=3870 RepID=A0A6A4PR32_LUPAL|nr:hypothetical protein Lalb_Chr11g0067651 [Lupinus albus]
MSRPLFQSLLRRHHHHHHHLHRSSHFPTTKLRDPFPLPPKPNPSPPSHHPFSNGTFSQFSLPNYHSTSRFLPNSNPKKYGADNTTIYRFMSLKTPFNSGAKFNADFAKKVFDKPTAAVTSAFSRYSTAIGLQIEAFCKRNYLFLFGAVGVLICGMLWKFMFWIANAFVGISEGLAKYGFLALSTAIVSFAGLYLRSRFTINPDKVYRIAMTKLNTSAGILEVMGAPLSGTELRAYVMSGGGFTLKKFKPSIRSRRCFLIFPIRGSERKGLVNVEVKKKDGQYDMKLLAVDIPMASGPDQRLFLIGDEQEYRVGGGLISELREPVVRAMAATKEFDVLDEIEEEEDAERKRQKAESERQEAERKHREEIEKIEISGT